MRGFAKFLIVLAVLAALYEARSWLSYRDMEKNSLSFVTGAVSKIGAGWGVEEFKKLADASLLSSGKSIDSAFASYRKLGTLKKPADCNLNDFTTYKYNTKINYSAVTYECHAEFQKGPATLRLIVVRFADSSSWKISFFDVISDFLGKQ